MTNPKTMFLKETKASDNSNKNDKKFEKLKKNQDTQLKIISQGFKTMNNALTALIDRSEIKIDNKNISKTDQTEDIKKIINIISKQEEKIETMNNEIQLLKNELNEIKSKKENKNEDITLIEAKRKVLIEVPNLNPNNVINNESMNYAKVVTKWDKRIKSIELSEIQNKEIVENHERRKTENLNKQNKVKMTENVNVNNIISLEEKNHQIANELDRMSRTLGIRIGNTGLIEKQQTN